MADDARFTEEMLFKGEPQDSTDFDVQVNKNCRKGDRHPPEDFVADSDVCYHCYYRELGEMMTDTFKVRPSKHLDFIHHQVKLRKDPLTFLQELEDLVVNNEGYLDNAEYGLHNKYLAIIKAIRERLETSLPDKIKAANLIELPHFLVSENPASIIRVRKLFPDLGFSARHCLIHHLLCRFQLFLCRRRSKIFFCWHFGKICHPVIGCG